MIYLIMSKHSETEINLVWIEEFVFVKACFSWFINYCVHSTRLGKSLLLEIPDLTEVNQVSEGKCVDIAFDQHLRISLDMLTNQSISDEMRDLYKAVKI